MDKKSILCSEDLIEKVEEIKSQSYNSSDAIARMLKNAMEGFTPFHVFKDGKGNIIFDMKPKSANNIKRVTIKNNFGSTVPPLFKSQKNMAQEFEEGFLSEENKRKRLIDLLTDKNNKSGEFRICFLIPNVKVTNKEESSKAMMYILMFFSWIMEKVGISYTNTTFFAATGNADVIKKERCATICAYASDGELNADDFLSQDNGSPNAFDVVFVYDSKTNKEELIVKCNPRKVQV